MHRTSRFPAALGRVWFLSRRCVPCGSVRGLRVRVALARQKFLAGPAATLRAQRSPVFTSKGPPRAPSVCLEKPSHSAAGAPPWGWLSGSVRGRGRGGRGLPGAPHAPARGLLDRSQHLPRTHGAGCRRHAWPQMPLPGGGSCRPFCRRGAQAGGAARWGPWTRGGRNEAARIIPRQIRGTGGASLSSGELEGCV